MALIKYYRRAGKITKNRLRDIKNEYAQAYLNATDEQRAYMDAAMRAGLNYMQAGGGGGYNSLGRFIGALQEEILDNMKSPTRPPVSITRGPNSFGYMGSEGSRDSAAYVLGTLAQLNNNTQPWYSGGGNRNGRGRGSNSPSGDSDLDTLFFVWNKYYDSGFMRPEASFADRGNLFKDAVSQALQEVLESDSKWRGITKEKAGRAMEVLLNINFNHEDTNATMNRLINFAKTLKIPASALKELFPEFWKELTQAEKNKKELLDSGEWDEVTGLTDKQLEYLNGNNILRNRKTGRYKVFGSEWDSNIADMKDILDDSYTYTNGILTATDSHGNVFMKNDKGEVFFGKVNQDGTIDDEYWQEAFNNLLRGIKNSKNNLYTWDTTYDPTNSFLMDENGDMYESELLSQISRLFGGRSFKYSDVSNLFEGDTKVVAVNRNGKELKKDKFGNPIFDNDTILFWESADGSIKRGTLVNAMLEMNISLRGFQEAVNQTGSTYDAFKDLYDLNSILDLENDYANRHYWGDGWWTSLLAGLWPALFTWPTLDNIQEDPTGFIKDVLNSYANPNYRTTAKKNAFTHLKGLELINNFRRDGKELLLAQTVLYLMEQSGYKSQMSSSELAGYKQMLKTLYSARRRAASTPPPSGSKETESKRLGGTLYGKDAYHRLLAMKNGGIVYAAKGESVSIFNRVADPSERGLLESADSKLANIDLAKKLAKEERADELGYDSLDRMDYDNELVGNHFKPADLLRMASMLTDVISLGSSIAGAATGGAGTAAAGVLGVGSTALDLTADFIDPSVSAGRALGNAATNLGFAALNMIPGAGTTKVVKNAVKWAPRLVAFAGTIGMATDPATKNALEKLNNGDIKGLTRADLKALNYLVKAATGLGRAGANAVASKKAVKGFSGSKEQAAQDLGKLSEETAFKSKNGKVSLNEAQKAEVEVLLKDGKLADAKAKIKSFNADATEAEINSMINTHEGRKWYGAKNGEKTYTLKGKQEKFTDKEVEALARKRFFKSEQERLAELQLRDGFIGSMERTLGTIASWGGIGNRTAGMMMVDSGYMPFRKFEDRTTSTRRLNITSRKLENEYKGIAQERWNSELEAYRNNKDMHNYNLNEKQGLSGSQRDANRRALLTSENKKAADVKNQDLIDEITSNRRRDAAETSEFKRIIDLVRTGSMTAEDALANYSSNKLIQGSKEIHTKAATNAQNKIETALRDIDKFTALRDEMKARKHSLTEMKTVQKKIDDAQKVLRQGNKELASIQDRLYNAETANAALKSKEGQQLIRVLRDHPRFASSSSFVTRAKALGLTKSLINKILKAAPGDRLKVFKEAIAKTYGASPKEIASLRARRGKLEGQINIALGVRDDNLAQIADFKKQNNNLDNIVANYEGRITGAESSRSAADNVANKFVFSNADRSGNSDLFNALRNVGFSADELAGIGIMRKTGGIINYISCNKN